MMRVYFKDMEKLAKYMQDLSRKGDTAAAFHYDDACRLVAELIKYHGYYSDLNIEIHNEMWDNYDGEYLITVSNGGHALDVEPALHGDYYIGFEAYMLFLSPDANTALAYNDRVSADMVMEVVFDDDELDYEDCDFAICEKKSEEPDHESDEDDMISVELGADELEKLFGRLFDLILG